MVRKLIGNIKGEKGDVGEQGVQGVKGDSGELTNQRIATRNLLNFSDMRTYPTDNTININAKEGVITYTDSSWYVAWKVRLKNVKHSFKVTDFTGHSPTYVGNIALRVMDSGTDVFNENVPRNTVVEVDLSDQPDEREYDVRLNFSGSGVVSGFIEKPMLVEGDFPVDWQMSDKDSTKFGYNEFITGSFTGEITGAISNTAETTINVVVSSLENILYTGNTIHLNRGYYLVMYQMYVTSETDTLVSDISVNGTNVHRKTVPNIDTPRSTVDVYAVIKIVEDGSELQFLTGRGGGLDATFTGALNNKFYIKNI